MHASSIPTVIGCCAYVGHAEGGERHRAANAMSQHHGRARLDQPKLRGELDRVGEPVFAVILTLRPSVRIVEWEAPPVQVARGRDVWVTGEHQDRARRTEL
eukprot:3114788-Pleurochrysis_carterae.AAC.2